MRQKIKEFLFPCEKRLKQLLNMHECAMVDNQKANDKLIKALETHTGLLILKNRRTL